MIPSLYKYTSPYSCHRIRKAFAWCWVFLFIFCFDFPANVCTEKRLRVKIVISRHQVTIFCTKTIIWWALYSLSKSFGKSWMPLINLMRMNDAEAKEIQKKTKCHCWLDLNYNVVLKMPRTCHILLAWNESSIFSCKKKCEQNMKNVSPTTAIKFAHLQVEQFVEIDGFSTRFVIPLIYRLTKVAHPIFTVLWETPVVNVQRGILDAPKVMNLNKNVRFFC